jgi:hypothetical protein
VRREKAAFSKFPFDNRSSKTANVRFGSKADIATDQRNVRFTPESGHSPTRSGCLLCAKLRHMRRSKERRYSITSSAAKSVFGT